MSDQKPTVAKAKPSRGRNTAPSASTNADPTATRNNSDPGDATGRNFRYQHAYGVMLLVASKRGLRPYTAIWCEQHEDFLAQRDDGIFDGYQVKTARPEGGPWTLRDAEFTKSIGRFVDLVAEFGGSIGKLYFVSNKSFDQVTPESSDTKRRSRCPELFLRQVRDCASRDQICVPYDGAFDELQASCGCEADQLIAVLRRVDLVIGPSRSEFDAALSHEHLANLVECRAFNAAQLDAFRDDLVGMVHRASSLQVTDPIRHLRPLIAAGEPDPVLVGKRIQVADVVYQTPTDNNPAFRFPGEPTLKLGGGSTTGVIEQKLAAADLEDQVDYMRERARAAEYSLLEDIARRPEVFPEMLQQIEQNVHGELAEAHLRARQHAIPYGPAMLIDVQERLRRLAAERAPALGNHGYSCLIGVAALLTEECRVWWGPRFPINVGTNQ